MEEKTEPKEPVPNPTPSDNQNPLNPNNAVSDMENEISPWCREFLAKHPNAADALKLEHDTKKEFVKNYYVADNLYQERLEKMVDEAEETLDDILSNEETKEDKYPEKFYHALINLSKGRHLDELMDIVQVFYTARRKTVKGMDINDPLTIHITQQCFNRMAIELPEIIFKDVESECKSRNLSPDRIIPVIHQILMSDLSINVDIERLWVLKKVEENKEKEITEKGVKDYICYSLALSHKLINGKLNPSMMFLLPHILSDNLFNKTGYEGEEIVYHVQEMLKEDIVCIKKSSLTQFFL